MRLFLIFNIIMVLCEVAAAVAPKNFFPVGKEGAAKYYINDKATCEADEGQPCYDVSAGGHLYSDIEKVVVDNLEMPIYKEKYKVVSCTDPIDCGMKVDALGFTDAESDQSSYCDQDSADRVRFSENSLMPGWSMYCTKVIGYEKIETESLVVNASKKADFDSKRAATIVRNAKLTAINKAKAFGEEIKQEISLINLDRNLTSAQIETFVNTFSGIERLLEAGAIVTAKEKIQALVPDEALLRAADRDAIVLKIDSFLGL